MLVFDDEKAAKRLMEEEPWQTYEEALRLVISRHVWDERLQSAFDMWVSGVIPEFEYEGISLKSLSEYLGNNYFYLMFCMNEILEDPTENIPWYGNRKNFIRI